MDYSLDEHIFAATKKQSTADHSAGYVQSAPSPVPVQPSPSEWRLAHHRRCLGNHMDFELSLTKIRAVGVLNIGMRNLWGTFEEQCLLELGYILDDPCVYKDQKSNHQYPNESHVTFEGTKTTKATISMLMNLILQHDGPLGRDTYTYSRC